MGALLRTFSIVALGSSLALAAPPKGPPAPASHGDRDDAKDKAPDRDKDKPDKDKDKDDTARAGDVDRGPSPAQQAFRRAVLERREKAMVAILQQDNHALNDD